MTEKIYFTPFWGYFLTTFSLGVARDDHGNKWDGEDVICKSGKKIVLNQDQWEAIQGPVFKSVVRDHKIDGITPLLDGLQSPLQNLCLQTSARKR